MKTAKRKELEQVVKSIKRDYDRELRESTRMNNWGKIDAWDLLLMAFTVSVIVYALFHFVLFVDTQVIMNQTLLSA
jgi:hypothetical protein